MLSYEKFYNQYCIKKDNKPLLYTRTEDEAKKIIFCLKSENVDSNINSFNDIATNYTVYHLHSTFSLLDSTTNYKDYIDYASSLGQKAICFTEHGNLYSWANKWMYARSKGLKYMIGAEFYLTETLEEKIRDNYHTVLIAKNADGVKELFELNKISTKDKTFGADCHVYYKNRITFEEFLNISDNIIKISACLQSPLWKYWNKIDNDECYYDNGSEWLDKLLKHYDYYEIQYHNNSEQIEFNKRLYEASKKYNKPLIVGTDTHSLNSYKAECRTILQYGKTDGVWGDEENECDLTYKTYAELVDMFKIQDSLPMDVVLEAIENTNKMADSVTDDYGIDTKTAKYPILYGDKDEEVMWERINNGYKEKVAIGEIEDNPQYLKNAEEEMRVFKKTNMIGFMLSMSLIIKWAKDNDIAVGFARGSCSGSTVAYLTDITDVDPVIRHTVFSRFCNEDRIELGDIDTDWYEDDRPKIYKHIIDTFGERKTSYIVAFGTLADKSVIDVIGKAFRVMYKNSYRDSCYSLEEIADIKKQWDTNKEAVREKYKDIFYFYDGLVGCEISQSMHPAGILVSSVDITTFCGNFYGTNKTGETVLISNIDMEECHDLNLVKYDVLGLKSVGVIDKTFKLIGKKFPKAYQVDWNDETVFKDIANDSTMLFQFESDFAKSSIKKMQPKSVEDICLCSACIRPSGESYREEVFAHKWNKNPSKLIDDILSNSYGFLVYQEQTIAFLQQVCGFSGSEADNIRRAIGQKNKEKIAKTLPKILDGYCNKSDKPRNIAEKEAKQFIKVIEDASGYSFGFNHSESYAMLTYLMGWLRYYYPTEFCTAYLLCAKNDEDLSNGTIIAQNRNCTIQNPKFGISTNNYGCDSSTRTIYKGVASIKDMQSVVGDELYELSQKKKYPNFLSLLFDIKTKTSCNKTSLDILIKLDYFSEFGDINYLLKVVDIYNKYIGKNDFGKTDRKQFRKSDLDKFYPIEKEAIEKFTTDVSKNGNTIYVSRKNIYKLVKYLCDNLKRDTTDIYDKVVYEAKYLGYTSITVPNSPYCVVESIDEDSYGRRFAHVNRLSDGSKGVFRCSKVWYNEYGLEQGQLIKAIFNKQPKKVKNEKGKWVNSKTEFYWELSAWS